MGKHALAKDPQKIMNACHSHKKKQQKQVDGNDSLPLIDHFDQR